MNLAPPTAKRSRRMPPLQLVSMVDMIFLLLIYFLASTSYTPPESHLAPALMAQQVAGGRAADLQPQVVEVAPVAGEPAYRIGERVLRSAEALRSVLEALPKDGGVFIKGSSAVQTRFVIEAIQAARDAGFVKVTYVPMES